METIRATSSTVACMLTPDDLKSAVAAWKKLLRASLVLREEVRGGLRLVLRPGSEGALRQLIDIERECCPWITFSIDGSSVTMTAEGRGEFAIREMWGCPVTPSQVCGQNSK